VSLLSRVNVKIKMLLNYDGVLISRKFLLTVCVDSSLGIHHQMKVTVMKSVVKGVANYPEHEKFALLLGCGHYLICDQSVDKRFDQYFGRTQIVSGHMKVECFHCNR
jgi:hypothetical protein